MTEWEKEAHGIARSVRGCTTDEQYSDLVTTIAVHLIEAYKLGFLAACDRTETAIKEMLAEPPCQPDDTP